VKEPESFYDWEKQYRPNSSRANRLRSEKKKVNSIGLLKEEFVKIGEQLVESLAKILTRNIGIRNKEDT